MSAARRKKDQEMATMLKKLGITRNTGQCPWGCGRSIPNGGPALSSHLNVCHGPKKG